MDYSAANHELWNVIIQLGYIAAVILIANFLRQTIKPVRQTMLPVAVLAGFILLLAKEIGIVTLDEEFLSALTYHGIALGFIAMSLRTPSQRGAGDESKVGFRSGAVIVSTYMVQAATGLIITIGLALTIKPDMFRAAGLLLPMGFGQGPGQANNVGASYQSLGFEGGHSFGLSIAAAGYVVACVVGVIILNVLRSRGRILADDEAKMRGLAAESMESEGSASISESIDKLSIQLAIVILVYLITFAVTTGITAGISALSEGLAGTVNTLLWGFNFIVGSALAILLRVVLDKLKARGAIKRPYQDNYLLNRLSGAFFDVMIVAGIGTINIEDIRGLVLPFVLLVIFGTITTWFHLAWVCKAVYGGYYYEGLISMYGMMTGTISSGILLVREIDPRLETPAANNLVIGSTFAILLGAPVLVLVGLATQSNAMCFATLGIALAYLVILDLIIFKVGRHARAKKA